MNTHFELGGDTPKTALPTGKEEENHTPEALADNEEEPQKEKEKLIVIPILGSYSKKMVMIWVGCLCAWAGIYLLMPANNANSSQDLSQMHTVKEQAAMQPTTAPAQAPTVQASIPPPPLAQQQEQQPMVDNHQLSRIDDELQALSGQVNALNDKLTQLENQKPAAPVAHSKPKHKVTHHVTRQHTTKHQAVIAQTASPPVVDIRQIHLLSLYPDLAWVRYQDSTYALHPGDSLAGLTVIAIDSHQRLVVTTAGNIH